MKWVGDYKLPNGDIGYKCGYGQPLDDPHLDVDFIKINGVWQKLRSGRVVVAPNDIRVHSFFNFPGIFTKKTCPCCRH